MALARIVFKKFPFMILKKIADNQDANQEQKIISEKSEQSSINYQSDGRIFLKKYCIL